MTLHEDNLLWLKGRAASRNGNVSSVLDALVTEARAGRIGRESAVPSVVGSIDIAPDDPALRRADAAIRALFAESLARPVLVRESAPPSAGAPRRRPKRG